MWQRRFRGQAGASPRRRARRLALAAALIAASLGISCTDALLQPGATEAAHADDRLSLTGRVCTRPPDPSGFPVKVVFVIDQSGSMCVSDPPGSQSTSGFCQQFRPEGVEVPARVRALKGLIAQFRERPNVSVAVVPFETNVSNAWPPTMTDQRFARPTVNSGIDAYADLLQSQLGKGTDYQGALAYAYDLIAGDIIDVDRNNPELLPRTRYVVVFLTDGVPYPRCSANDNLDRYATPDRPELTYADSYNAEEFCNLTDPSSPDQITGFVPGTDRNQNYQLFSYVDRLVELKDAYNIGDLRLHTVLLFNEEAVRGCGLVCQDLYGQYPEVTPEEYPQAAKAIARYTLQELSARGGGVFQEFNDGEIQSLGLGALDYSSLASPFVMKSLVVEAGSSVSTPEGRAVDSDGDGLADALDSSVALGTNPFLADSDGDCFDDGFELRRAHEGFQAANVLDARGCDPSSPLTLGCACRDTDGDGLSQFAEAYMNSRTGLMDSDGDGIPDGMEVRYGLAPRAATLALRDTDGDGIRDLDELRAGTDPTVPDRALFERDGFQYATREEVLEDGSVCYAFTVSNLKLVTPPSRSGTRQGYNLFKLHFAESPRSGVATDYGVWRTACAWAQFDPPSVRAPQGPSLTLTNGDFYSPHEVVDPADLKTRCVGSAP